VWCIKAYSARLPHLKFELWIQSLCGAF
jgi:hypothetical protein